MIATMAIANTTDDSDDAGQHDADRKTVVALVAHDDPLTKARPVDHWAYFGSAEARHRFVDEVVPRGRLSTG